MSFEYKMLKDENGVGYFADELLKKYGLDKPEVAFSYRFDDENNKVKTRTEAYISAKDEKGVRYCYSRVFVLNDDGTETIYPTGNMSITIP